MLLETLARFSNRYGSDPDLVLCGGGNTSAKDGNVMYVKASGTSLGTIRQEGFAAMDRKKLGAMMEKTYPEADAPREAAALSDLMDARMPDQGDKRPSVETLLHNLFPTRFVLHLHPALVNGMTCAKNGEAVCRELFPEAVWVGECKPGYILAKTCYTLLGAYKAEHGTDARLVFLKNHGVFFAADDEKTLDTMLQNVLQTLRARCTVLPDLAEVSAADPALGDALAALYGENACWQFCGCADAVRFAESAESMLPLSEPFSPDHIVYCKAYPLYLADAADAKTAFEDYTAKNGFAPQIIYVRGQGFYAVADSETRAQSARALAIDAIKIARYAENFGGAEPQRKALTDFIIHWEVESYRAKLAK